MAQKSKMDRTKLGQHLQRQGIDLRTLAAKMGYNHSWLWRLCIGDRKPSAREEIELPKLLGLTAEVLFGNDPTFNPLALIDDESLRAALRAIREDDSALWLLSQLLNRCGELMAERQESTR